MGSFPPPSTITTATTTTTTTTAAAALSPAPSLAALSSSITGSPVEEIASPASVPGASSQHASLQLAALSVVGVASSLANLLVLVTILMTRKLRSTPSSVLVTSLALADVAVTSLTVPLAACGLVNQRWVFSQMTCTLMSTLSGVFSAASALSVAAIAMDRYLAILYCLRFSTWPRWHYVLIMLAFTWLPALLFGVLVSTDAATTRYIPELHVCDVVASQSKTYVWARAVVVFFCPLAVLTFAYARVINVARIHSRKIDVVAPRNQHRKGSNENSRRTETVVSPNGAVAAGAMFSVRRLSIISIPRQAEGSSRRQFHIRGNVEVVTPAANNAGRAAGEDASNGPQKRSCASLKLILLVVVLALCCGFHTAVGLYETVVHHHHHHHNLHRHHNEHSASSGNEESLLKSQAAPGERLLSTGLSQVEYRSNVTKFPRQEEVEKNTGNDFSYPHRHDQQHSGSGLANVDAIITAATSDHPFLLSVGFWLLLINSLLNPFLYAISSQRFRYFALRLFTKHDPHGHHHHHHHHHRNGNGRDPCGGGHLFDVSIYSAFLRNLQTPSSRRSSGCDSCYGELSQQQFPLTALAPNGSEGGGSFGGGSASRRDSGCSVGTASTSVMDNLSCSSAGNSPVPRHKQLGGGGRNGAGGGGGGWGGGSGEGGRGPSSQFLEVPFSSGNEDTSPTLSRITSFMPGDITCDDVEEEDDDMLDSPQSGAGDIVVTDGKKTSVTSVGCGNVCTVCEYRSVPFRTGSAASGGTGLGAGHVSIEDDFTFSANNAARIRIVLDLV